jgi:hypothetical protein
VYSFWVVEPAGGGGVMVANSVVPEATDTVLGGSSGPLVGHDITFRDCHKVPSVTLPDNHVNSLIVQIISGDGRKHSQRHLLDDLVTTL